MHLMSRTTEASGLTHGPEMKLLLGSMNGDGAPKKFWNRQERRLWVGCLFLGCSMIYATRTVMPLCVVAVSQELQWDKTQSGTVLSAFFWGYTLTQILGGYFSDKIGGDIVLMLAAVGWSVITFWTPMLVTLFEDKHTVLVAFTLSRVLLGCCQGVHFPGISSLMSKKVNDEDRAFSFATAVAGSHFGTMFCGSVGSVLLDLYGWTSTFYVIGLLGMAWLLFLRYYVVARERRKAMVLSLKENMTMTLGAPSGPVPWLALIKQPAFWSILLGQMAHTNSFFILLSWLPTYFHETYPGAKGWVFNVVPWLVTIPSGIGSGWVADYLIAKGYSVTFVRKLMETISLFGTGIALLCLCTTSHYGAGLFCMAVAVACCGIHNSGILINPQDIAPKYAGSVFGLMNTAGAVPGFVGVYLAGYVLETTGKWTSVFSQTAFICFAGGIIFLIFGTGKQIVK
ncbi:hypothetical protein NP493_2g17004 [Ridgeia piscesae]|uniref:Major facilitator superfamily (MFS) profile domain-containing protein n=1 Tax=Ridgeia piscesae TaxID=27915 RepID=A0AAD9PG45_RIDPI|nr:hypothetical protein NP493_2g17004 [Ridgeia piscesae]